jgi:hypothetical protein
MSEQKKLSIEPEPTARRTVPYITNRTAEVPKSTHQRECISNAPSAAKELALQPLPVQRLFKIFPPSRRRSMSSASFWSDACNDAEDRPLQTKLNAAYGSCGATVRRARAAVCVLRAAV